MRRKLVAGNWKMHGTQQFVREQLNLLRDGLGAEAGNADIVICPATIHLPLAAQLLVGCSLSLGAQNVFYAQEGAFTGEISAAMLAEYQVKYVIVGHSERRQHFAENDALVAAKFAAAQKEGLRPILCVGESWQQRESGDSHKVVLGQLANIVQEVGIAAFAHAVVAYEPVWAIGTGQTASPAHVQEVHAVIRNYLHGLDKNIADQTRIVYGGSVTAKNAADLFAQQDIDGGLVGGASLNADDFISICKSLD